jgi:hypothetical protein
MSGPNEPAAPADGGAGPVPDGHGDDDIINDILGGEDKPRREPPPGDDDDPPEPETPEREEPEPEPEEDEEEADLEEAAETDEDDAPADGDLVAARAALKDGDIDQAMMLAFGKKPEELLPNAHTWTQWRKANEREDKRRRGEQQKLEAEVQQARQWVHGERTKIGQTIEALRPYEKYYLAEQAFQRDGDPQHLVTIIEGVGGGSFNDVQKVILTKTKRSPQERQMAERLQLLERKLQETTQEREQQQSQLSEQQIYQNDLAHIRQHVKGPVTQLPKFEQRIYNVILKTRSSLGNTLTVEQAAERIMKAERKRLASHPFVRKPGKKVPPAATAAARTLAARAGKNRGAPLRRNSQNNGAPDGADESTDDIVNDILKSKPRRVG